MNIAIIIQLHYFYHTNIIIAPTSKSSYVPQLVQSRRGELMSPVYPIWLYKLNLLIFSPICSFWVEYIQDAGFPPTILSDKPEITPNR